MREEVEIRRSRRRRRTASARREGDRMVVMVPAGLSERIEADLVTRVLASLEKKEARAQLSDAQLQERAIRLAKQYLGGLALPLQVRWVTNQDTRWGSCTPATRTIRISHRVGRMPNYVLDYVLLHELAHLLVPGHGDDFWALLTTYPKGERARGFLDGVSLAQGIFPPESDVDQPEVGELHEDLDLPEQA